MLHKTDDGRKKADSLPLSDLGGIGLISDDLADVAADAGGLFLAEIGLADNESLFDRVNERAVAYARERGAELVSGVDEATRNELAELISTGLQENIGMDAIADTIRDAYAFSEKRADLIARTEIAFANQNGVLEGMKGAREAGVKIKKVWLPDALACDECLENGEDGAIDLDDMFSGTGDDAPPAHPNCRCTIISEIQDDNE